MTAEAWSRAAVEAVSRAFQEYVEAECPGPLVPGGEGSAMHALRTIKDSEVPASSRCDLIVVQLATRLDERSMRGLARLYAAASDPGRVQPQLDHLGGIVGHVIDGETTAPARVDEGVSAAALVMQDISFGLTGAPGASLDHGQVRLNEFTLTEMHVRTLMIVAELTDDSGVRHDCEAYFYPETDLVVSSLRLRRRLAAYYNYWLLDGAPMGSWKPHALRAVRRAWQTLFHRDERMPAGDLLKAVQRHLERIHETDVEPYAREDLVQLRTASDLNMPTLQAMSRLMQHASDWQCDRLFEVLGQRSQDAN